MKGSSTASGNRLRLPKKASVLRTLRLSQLNGWHAAAPIILLFGAWWIWVSRPPVDLSTFDAPRPLINHPAPDFSLPLYRGNDAETKHFILSELQGTPVVLNFWATWCGPCRREFPALQTAAARYGACQAENSNADRIAQCVLIVGVNQGESASTVERFLAEVGGEAGAPDAAVDGSTEFSQLSIVLDSSLDVGQLYNVQGLPLTYFIDEDGVIRSVWSGEMNSVILAENISKISQ